MEQIVYNKELQEVARQAVWGDIHGGAACGHHGSFAGGQRPNHT